MCGIAGVFVSHNSNDGRGLNAIEPMLAALHHRGPDGGGAWSDREVGLALGHRRLAIIDLTDAGRQPMVSQSGRFVITFNGEVYNFASLRRDLLAQGCRFQGGSDTEVMLNAIERWGLEPALQSFAGMFAFALWDREKRVLHFARDRLGKKPLYVAVANGALFFASELKSLRAFPNFSPQINRDAATAMLSTGSVPDSTCIWNNVFKIPPGALLTVTKDDVTAGIDVLKSRIHTWWSMSQAAQRASKFPATITDGEMVSELDHLLADRRVRAHDFGRSARRFSVRRHR